MSVSRLTSLAMLVTLASCASKFTRLEGDPVPVRQWKSAALVEVVVAPAQTPVFPLLDAAVYTASMDKVAPALNDIHGSMVDTLTEQMQVALAKASALEILAGRKLAGLDAYANSGVESKPLEVASKKYPTLHVTTGAKNLVDPTGQEFTDEYLDSHKPSPAELYKLATALQVDGLVIGMVSAPTLAVGIFGTSGKRVARVSLYFFDAQGKFLLKGYGQTDPNGGAPGDLAHYSKILGFASPLTYEIAKTVFPAGAKKSAASK